MNQNIRIAKQLIRIAKSLLAEQQDFTKKFAELMKTLGFDKSSNKYIQSFEIDNYNDVDVTISEPKEKDDKFICTLSEEDSHGNSDSVEIQFASNEFATELENGMKELKGFGKIYKSIDYSKIK